jgi:cobalt-zinc-cadmium efflux system protein
MSKGLDPALAEDLRRAARLEWWTLAWMISVIAVMGAVAGGSQAMRTAWIEDVLSLVPAIVFLVAVRFERRGATAQFPFGFLRVNSLSFLIAAVALAATGSVLLVESLLTLIQREHVTIPPVNLFGSNIWLGWLMVAALVYSVIPPLILGRMKLPLARRLQDKVLHTDAMMQKADWMTGLAGAAGVIGLGLGLWWADAAAASIISLSILHDGLSALRIATAELVDGSPRAIDSDELAEDAEQLKAALQARYPGASVRLRETGRYIAAEVHGTEGEELPELRSLWPGPADRAWRLAQLSFVPSTEASARTMEEASARTR